MIFRKNVINDSNEEQPQNNRIEIFREINVQMLNSRNIYEGLDLEWGETSIDTSTNNSSKDMTEVCKEI